MSLDILSRKQVGLWYEYQLAVDGQKVGVKVACETVQTMPESQLRTVLERQGRVIAKLPRNAEALLRAGESVV